MRKELKRQYPLEDEPWSSITEEELEKKGFKYDDEMGWYHPKCIHFVIRKNPHTEKAYWQMYHVIAGVNADGTDGFEEYILRDITYMYQIDNMFHGFTDRWLGLI